MNLHGEEVKLNDRVFDISSNRGYGSVIRIEDNFIEVKFSRLSAYYSEEGIQKNRDWPTLFWDKPLVVPPTKEEEHWSAKRTLVKEFFTIVEKYKGYV